MQVISTLLIPHVFGLQDEKVAWGAKLVRNTNTHP